MERDLFFATKDKVAKESRRKRLERNGYVFGAHRQADSIRNKNKRIPKTKRRYNKAVMDWVDFTKEYEIKGYELGSPCVAPDHTLVKDFLRWYSLSARGQKAKNGRPVMKSVLCCAERLFGGFEESMQISIVMDDRKEVFNWIKRTLTEDEKMIENVEDPNHSFTKKDFLRVVTSMWQVDHRRFMPGLLKAIIMLALQLYLFTGARIGAFIPEHEDRLERGLRYKHITLVLFPSATTPWKLEWKVDQVWLKGNRNPEYTVFGIGIRDTKRPQFAAGYILLAIALQHGALFGIETVDDLANFDLSGGQPIELRWKEEYLEKPVLRNVTAEGPQDVPLDMQRFCGFLRAIITAAGYNKSITIHKIRKFLGSVVEGKHGSALVSQIYGHKDAGTYPKDYVLHCSSIDTVSAVLGEEEDKSHIEYFQGFERFYEHGLPGELPAQVEERLLQEPELVEIRGRITQLEALDEDKESLNAERSNYRKALVRFRLSELKKYQSSWIRERRDQRILNKGKGEQVIDDDNDTCTRTLALIMPEFARISTLMSFDGMLSFNEMLLFVEDLKTYCGRDFDVVYLPQESPVAGRCPTEGCRKEMKCLKKSDRSAHIHNCVRRGIALDFQVLESKLKYCYECMEWYQLSQWRDHCSFHLQSWKTQHCEVIVYRHTVVRPGYCPFCVWNQDLVAEDRLHSWLTSGNLRQHVEEQHMNGDRCGGTKLRCGCGQIFDKERELRHHLHDVHKLNKAIWLNPKHQRKRKHACKEEAQISPAEPEERRSKRPRFYRYPPPRHEHEHQLSNSIFIPVPTLRAFVEEHPEQYYCSSLSDKSTQSSRGSSVSPCSSANSSPLSSRPTTPGLDVIDPRILDPLGDYKARTPQLCGQDYSETDVLEVPPDGQEVKSQLAAVGANPGFHIQIIADQSIPRFETTGSCSLEPADQNTNDANQLQLPNPSPIETNAIDKAREVIPTELHVLEVSTTGFTASEAIEEKENPRDAEPGSRICSDAEMVPEHYCPANPSLIDGATPRGTDSITGLKKPLTRAQARRQPTQPSSNHSAEKTLRRKLTSREKRELREFKSQNYTLRQIGPHFVGIDMVSLRQAWTDIKPAQRCTRSRANQMSG